MTAPANTIALDFNPAGPLPFIARTALGIAGELQPRFPAFDPKHPDQEILDAFEKVREHRAWAYAQEDVNGGAWPEAFERKADDLALAEEVTVQQTFASTPAGVAARLSLLIPAENSDRWVDQCVMQNGLLSLYTDRHQLDGNGSQLAQAAYELVYIEWDYALAAYEQGRPNASFGADVVDEVDEVLKELPEFADRLAKLRKMGQAFERTACNMTALNRLVRTLAPDAQELLRKTEIMAEEHFLDEWSAPWLARDAAFLAGRLDGSPPERIARRRAPDGDSPDNSAKQEA